MKISIGLTLFFLCAVLMGSVKSQIDTLHNQAYALLDSDPDKALVLAKQAEDLAHNRGLDFEEANSLFIQAYLYRENNELGKAFVINLRALEILRPLEEEKPKSTYVKILLNTGEILKQHYAYPEAVRYYDEGIPIAIENDFKNTLIKLLYNKAVALRHNESFDYALETIEKAISVAIEERDEYKLISAINEKGLIEKDMELYEQARQSYQEILDYEFERLNPAKYKGRAWHNMGVTFVKERDYNNAKKAFSNAEKYHSERPGSSDQFTTWLDMGEVYFLSGQYNEAMEIANKAHSIYDGVSLLPDHYALFDLLSKICHEQGLHDDSHSYSQRYVLANKDFLAAQEEILRVKDQYKMEVLTAGFFLDIEQEKSKERLRLYLFTSIAFFIVLIAGRQVWFVRLKRAIEREMKKTGGEKPLLKNTQNGY